MIKVGITGGIGSGKSTVCRIFALLGIETYYTDIEAKRLMHCDTELRHKITELFGSEAYIDNQLNNKYIASKVFGNKELINKLNAIVHPAVIADFEHWAENRKEKYVIEESAILFQSGAAQNVDFTIAVIAPVEIRIRRVIARDGLDYEAVKSRISHQMSDQEFAQKADFVIVADDIQPVITQVIEIHNEILNSLKI